MRARFEVGVVAMLKLSLKYVRTLHKAVKLLEPWGILLAVIGFGFTIYAFQIERADREEDRINRAIGQFAAGIGRVDAWQVLRRNDVDLKALQAPNAYLPRADMSGANLEGANFAGANFWEADLSGATLDGANLSGANFGNANLKGASFHRANLTEAFFIAADLIEGADDIELLRPTEVLVGEDGDIYDLQITRRYSGASPLDGAIFCQTVWLDARTLNEDCNRKK